MTVDNMTKCGLLRIVSELTSSDRRLPLFSVNANKILKYITPTIVKTEINLNVLNDCIKVELSCVRFNVPLDTV